MMIKEGSMKPQRRIYKGGRIYKGWRRGERVQSVRELRRGTRIICVSHQFKTENLAVVTNARPHPFPEPTRLVYAAWAKGRAGKRAYEFEFAIWDFMVEHGLYYRAERTG